MISDCLKSRVLDGKPYITPVVVLRVIKSKAHRTRFPSWLCIYGSTAEDRHSISLELIL